MTGAIPLTLPIGAAAIVKVLDRLMEIILHAGAHRTSTTSFQDYLRNNAAAIEATGTTVWNPRRTRKQLFPGLFPGPHAARGRDLRKRAEGRVRMHLELARAAGVKRLLVTEENVIGTPRQCVKARTLYPALGERMARIYAAFDGRIDRIVLSIRAQDLWWASAMAYGAARGHSLPDREGLAQIAEDPRSWRDVITDLACAMPQAQILVLPFEHFAGRARDVFQIATGQACPATPDTRWLNRAPDLAQLNTLLAERGATPPLAHHGTGDRWQPFDAAQQARLREAYADDLFWLTAGADGLATLTEDPTRTRAGTSLPPRVMTKGHDDDIEERHLARSG